MVSIKEWLGEVVGHDEDLFPVTRTDVIIGWTLSIGMLAAWIAAIVAGLSQ